MKQAAAKTTHAHSGDELPVAGTLGMDALDTAWRMAVPVILAATAGIFLDRSLKSGPWITLVATAIGLGVSGWLIKRQLAALEREERKKK